MSSLDILPENGHFQPNSSPDNAISQMITNILSTSYNDPSLRQALSILDEKLHENTPENRRQLRSDIESSVIKSSNQTLKDFSKLHKKLTNLKESIDDLNNQYNQMDKLVNQATKDTFQIQRQSQQLRRDDEALSIKKSLLDSYQNNFIINDEELSILNTGLVNGEQFFTVLEKIKRIHKDCQVLLSTEENSQTGMDIMNQMSLYLDKGYDKILQSVQNEFKKMEYGQYLQISKSLTNYLMILSKERPTLFDNALNGLIETRQKNLLSDFINALTVETKSSKPIDFYAYDILRYVGDIMAWIHSAIVGEEEILENLLPNDDETLKLKLDKLTSSLVKPLRLRIEQVISSEDNITNIYKVGNILDFYSNTFLKTFHSTNCAIIVAISRLYEASIRQFNKDLENKIALQRDNLKNIGGSKNDLQPPNFLLDALVDTKSILSSYQQSITFVSPPSNQFKQTLHDLIEPYLEFCNRISENLPRIDSEIFLINCYDATKSTLSLFPFVSYKVDQLETRTEELCQVLEDSQYYNFLNSSGISNLLNTNKTLSRDLINNKQLIIELAISLDNFLPAANMESSLLLHRLSSPRLSSSISLRASQRFVLLFEQLKSDLETLYGLDQSTGLLPRSVSEVKTLLALD